MQSIEAMLGGGQRELKPQEVQPATNRFSYGAAKEMILSNKIR
jgi:hypothetical protein